MLQQDIDVFKHYDLPFETYFNKQITHKTQIHDELELIWVLRGKVDLICEGKSFILTRQNLFMVNPYHVHTLSSSEDSLIITYRFKKEYLLKSNHSFENMVFDLKVHTLEELVEKYKEVPLLISELLRLLIDPNPSQLIRYKIVGYYNMLIYELYTMLLKDKYLDVKKKDINKYIDRIQKTTEYLNQNFLKRITLDDLSNHIGISRYRTSHFIKEQIGISFREYVFNMRMEYALRLLRESDIPVLDIVKSSGFSDVKYLNSMLKNRFNITALKYRKSFRKKIEEVNSIDKQKEFFNELNICLDNIDIYTKEN